MNEKITHQITTTDASTFESQVLHPLSNIKDKKSASESTVSSPYPSDLLEDQAHKDDHSAGEVIKTGVAKSQSTSNLESMRRRNKIESNSSDSPSKNVKEGQYFHHYGQRRSRSMIIERTGSKRYGQSDEYDDHSVLQERMSPTQTPQISEFMSTDKDYVDFLLRGNDNSVTQRIFFKQEQYTPTHLQISNFCTWFSLIAVMILTLFGVLIETQPLYIKGISPQRTPYIRVLHVNDDGQIPNAVDNSPTTNAFSWVHFSGRLRILDSYRDFKNQNNENDKRTKFFKKTPVENVDDHGEYITYDYVRQGKDYHERRMSSENIRFEMKKEAKTAFKTAALYFLTMILSIVYSQNHEYIRQHYRHWNLFGRLTQAILLRRYFSIVYNRYKRRNYSDLEGENAFFSGRIFRGGRNANVRHGNVDVELSLPSRGKRGITSVEKGMSVDECIAISNKDSDEFVDHGEIPNVWDEVLSGGKSKKR
jgi:hypothetical protein